MYTIDFEYDGKRLSDFGMMICTFDSSGLETVSSGADITFNTIKSVGSNKVKMYGSKYEEMYTNPFQICKNPCSNNDNMYFETNEESALQRWLCRKDGYHQFKPIQEDLKDVYWNASFSSKQINLGGKIIGLELTMYTDSPYAYLSIGDINYSVNPNDSFSIFDSSDEVGFIYPIVEITCNGDGKIVLQNNMDKKKLILTNVTQGEIITLDGENKIPVSSANRPDFPNCFNYHYPRIFNKIENGIDVRENIFTLSSDSVPCDITFKYSPIVKIGL